MAIDKIFNDANVDGIADNIFGAVNNSVSEVKQMQQRKAAENVQMVVEAFKKIETNITEKFDNVTDVIEKRVLTIKDGRDGSSGSDGRNGRDGKPGRDGVNGKQGTPGTPGKDGTDGVDGVSVTDASIDFDGSLVISLSSGQQINVGEVVPPELERQLVELRQGGGGAAGSSGDVTGPAASTDNAIVRFDGTTGKVVQNSVVTIADTTGNMAGVGTLGVGAITTTGALVGAATQSVFNTVSTTLNLGGAATAVNIGAATGTLTVANTTLAAKRITASTTLAVTGVSTLTSGAVIEGMTVGLGSGAVATNTAVGFGALLFNINGTFNSALGYEALRYNTTGYSNTATGSAALHENSSGYANTAMGSSALYYNTLGDSNVATGASALLYNISGSSNTVSGTAAMQSNATGSRNTAIGAQALITYTPPVVTAGAFVIATAYTIVTVGTTNFVAIGASANTVGVVFTATGAGSGTGTASTNVDATNTALGYGAGSTITTGTKNTIIGAYTGNQGGLDIRTASNHIVLSDGDGNPRGYFNASGVLTLSSALPVASGGTGITSFGTGVATWLGTPSSANLAAAVTDETGSGALVFGTSPTFTTSVIGGATMAVFNTTSTTVNAFGAATALNIGAATGTLTVANTTLAAKAITATTVTTTGDMAVGTTADSRFRVLGAGANPGAMRIGYNGTSTNYFDANTTYFRDGSGNTVAIVSSTALALQSGISLTGGISGTGYSFSGSAPATSLTLDATGQLTVGTADAAYTGVKINGVGTVAGISPIFFGGSGSQGIAGIAGVVENAVGNTAGGLAFYTRSVTTNTAPTERARIDSSGRLLVGLTSASNYPQAVSWQNANSADGFCTDWNGVSSATINLATLFATLFTTSGSTVSVDLQIVTSSGSTAATAQNILALKRGDQNWYFLTYADLTQGGTTITATGSGATITLTFGTGSQYGVARVKAVAH